LPSSLREILANRLPHHIYSSLHTRKESSTPSESGESGIDRVDLQSKGLEFVYIPAVVDRTLEQLLLESLPTMRVKKQNLHEENVEVPLGATSEGYRNLLLGG